MKSSFLLTILLAVFVVFTGEIGFARLETPLIFAVNYEDDILYVYINSSKVWNERGVLTDSYTPEEDVWVEEVAEKACLLYSSESTYESCNSAMSKAQLIEQLKKTNPTLLSYNVEFQEFIEAEAHNEIIYLDTRYQSHTAVYKMLYSLFKQFSYPLDLMGDGPFYEDDYEKLRQTLFPPSSFYDDEGREVVKNMSSEGFLSNWKAPIFNGKIDHMSDRIIPANIERYIHAVLENPEISYEELLEDHIQ